MNRNLKSNQGDKTWLWVAIGVVVAGGAALVYVKNRPDSTPPPAVTAAPLPPPAAAATAPEHHPIEESQLPAPPAQSLPLPPTDQTDPIFSHLFTDLVGDALFNSLFENKDILHRVVATIDNLPRETVPARVWALKPAPGHFLVSGKDNDFQIAPENTVRYAAYLQLVRATDAHRLVELYVRNYPLFQKAYQELGYPQGYFNDRVIYAIDNLLATPPASPTQALVQPHVLYQYADPSLEALSFGQKTLLRMGPDDENTIKDKLREIRALLVKQHP
jgi:hypothetical protein